MSTQTLPTYAEYLAYAKSLGIAPYTERQWAKMGAMQKQLLGVLISRG